MEFIRVFTNPQRCMQRLGFLKYLLWRASRSATNNFSTLGKELIDFASQKVSVTLSSQLRDYFKTTRTAPLSGPINESADGTMVDVEIQDLYLADLDIPSRRGRLVRNDWRRYTYLALDLCLLRRGTYSLMPRGQAFLALLSEEERKGFSNRAGITSTDGGTNPLRLSVPERLLLLFSFVEHDGDILEGLYEKLFEIREPFSDWEVGNYLDDIYRFVAKTSRSRVKSGDDLLKIQQLLDTADKITAWKGRQYKGKGARDEAATIRLEPFVDIGLLSKPDPFAYRYLITDATKAFFEPLIKAQSIKEFLYHFFFDVSNKVFTLKADRGTDRPTMLSTIKEAYNILKNPLGYAPILEVCLLAGIYSVTGKGRYFELSESVDVLKSLQKESPELVRFNVDRWGALTFVKFTGGSDG